MSVLVIDRIEKRGEQGTELQFLDRRYYAYFGVFRVSRKELLKSKLTEPFLRFF